MGAEQFFRLCEQLPFQEGSAVRGIAEHEANQREHEREREGGGGGMYDEQPGYAPQAASSGDGVAVVPDTVAPLHAGFAGDGREFPPAVRVRTPRRKAAV
jgi:hypothetical protein